MGLIVGVREWEWPWGQGLGEAWSGLGLRRKSS